MITPRGEQGLPYAEVVRAPVWLVLLLQLGPLACVGAGVLIASRGDLRVAVIVAGIGVVVGLSIWLFSNLRILVTATEVRARFGPFGLKVPRERLERADATRYSALSYGGWGIRVGFDGSYAYTVPGDGGRGVRIRYQTPKGRRRTVVISSNDPEKLARLLTS